MFGAPFQQPEAHFRCPTASRASCLEVDTADLLREAPWRALQGSGAAHPSTTDGTADAAGGWSSMAEADEQWTSEARAEWAAGFWSSAATDDAASSSATAEDINEVRR